MWKSTATCLLALPVLAGAAVIPTEWPQQQAVAVAAPGLVTLAVPAATFDNALPDLADLRLIGSAGQEIPYLLDRGAPRPAAPIRPLPPRAFGATPAGDTTQLLIETGTTDPLEYLELETTVPFFLKAAHVEVSPDGVAWQSLGPALPVFRQFGAEQLRLALDRQPGAFIRVTLDDFRSRQVAFTGARLMRAPLGAAPPVLAPLGARIARRDEFAGETVLTVELDGRHVPLAALGLAVRDPLFMRRVTVTVREVNGAIPGERLVGAGTLYRVALDGAPARAQLELPLEFAPPVRELLVHIHNGDSPPLAVDGVQAQQHPVNLLFLAPAAGSYALLSGNTQAAAPRYDLAAFAGEMRAAGAAGASAGPLQAMPDYHPRESLGTPPLPDVPLAGAPLDTRDWSAHRAVQLARPGVQELELDPGALAGSQAGLADVRLLRGGNQIPYVLEQPALARALALTATSAPDPKHPSLSTWLIRLPHARLPLRALILTSATPLFQRQFRLYEKFKAPDGSAAENTLAAGAWSRTPEPGVPETRIFELPERLRTGTLWLETDNGDNPPVALGSVAATYPVVRLIFKTAETDGFTLGYGNPDASAPRYDLSLVAAKLLTSSRNVASLPAGEANGADTAATPLFAGIDRRYVFWGALALVVIVLLVVVARLLPKPPAG